MLGIAKITLILLVTASPGLGEGGGGEAIGTGNSNQAPATPAEAAHTAPVPRETTTTTTTTATTATGGGGGSSSVSLLANLFRLARGLKLTRCAPYAIPLIPTLPRLPPGLVGDGNGNDLVTQALSQTTLALSEVCDFSVTGGAVADAYTAFLPAWYGWHSAHRPDVDEVLRRCPAAAPLVSTLEAYRSCPQVVAAIAAATVTGDGGGGQQISAVTETAGTASGLDATATATATTSGDTSDITETGAPGTAITVSGAAESPSKDTEFMLAAAATDSIIGIIAEL